MIEADGVISVVKLSTKLDQLHFAPSAKWKSRDSAVVLIGVPVFGGEVVLAPTPVEVGAGTDEWIVVSVVPNSREGLPACALRERGRSSTRGLSR